MINFLLLVPQYRNAVINGATQPPSPNQPKNQFSPPQLPPPQLPPPQMPPPQMPPPSQLPPSQPQVPQIQLPPPPPPSPMTQPFQPQTMVNVDPNANLPIQTRGKNLYCFNHKILIYTLLQVLRDIAEIIHNNILLHLHLHHLRILPKHLHLDLKLHISHLHLQQLQFLTVTLLLLGQTMLGNIGQQVQLLQSIIMDLNMHQQELRIVLHSRNQQHTRHHYNNSTNPNQAVTMHRHPIMQIRHLKVIVAMPLSHPAILQFSLIIPLEPTMSFLNQVVLPTYTLNLLLLVHHLQMHQNMKSTLAIMTEIRLKSFLSSTNKLLPR